MHAATIYGVKEDVESDSRRGWTKEADAYL